MYSGKSGYIRGKFVVFGQIGGIWAKVVVFRKTWLYSSKSCCLRANVDILGQGDIIHSEVVVFGQIELYSDKMVVFGQK